MDRGTWQATLYGVAKSQAPLSSEHKHSFYIVLAVYHRKHQKQFQRDMNHGDLLKIPCLCVRAKSIPFLSICPPKNPFVFPKETYLYSL